MRPMLTSVSRKPCDILSSVARNGFRACLLPEAVTVMSAFFKSIGERLVALFEPQALGVAAAEFIANVVVAVTTFAAYYLFWRIADLIAKSLTRRTKVDRTTRDFMLTALKFSALTLAAVNALTAVGVNTASLITSLGIAGLTLGFAARDALSNLISGILIYWDRPFVIGDLLEIGGHYGRVDKITLRSTRVITPDGRMLAVPNTEIINSTVASYTNFPHLRIDIPVTIGVNEDLDRARNLLLDLVQDTSTYMKDPPAVVVVKELNDYNVEIELQVWLHDERKHVATRTELREAAYKTLMQAGVDMPFETLRVEPITVQQEQVD